MIWNFYIKPIYGKVQEIFGNLTFLKLPNIGTIGLYAVIESLRKKMAIKYDNYLEDDTTKNDLGIMYIL